MIVIITRYLKIRYIDSYHFKHIHKMIYNNNQIDSKTFFFSKKKVYLLVNGPPLFKIDKK